MGRQRKEENSKKSGKKRRTVQNDILMFDAAARARGMSYAEAQVKETCELVQWKCR